MVCWAVILAAFLKNFCIDWEPGSYFLVILTNNPNGLGCLGAKWDKRVRRLIFRLLRSNICQSC